MPTFRLRAALALRDHSFAGIFSKAALASTTPAVAACTSRRSRTRESFRSSRLPCPWQLRQGLNVPRGNQTPPIHHSSAAAFKSRNASTKRPGLDRARSRQIPPYARLPASGKFFRCHFRNPALVVLDQSMSSPARSSQSAPSPGADGIPSRLTGQEKSQIVASTVRSLRNKAAPGDARNRQGEAAHTSPRPGNFCPLPDFHRLSFIAFPAEAGHRRCRPATKPQGRLQGNPASAASSLRPASLIQAAL